MGYRPAREVDAPATTGPGYLEGRAAGAGQVEVARPDVPRMLRTCCALPAHLLRIADAALGWCQSIVMIGRASSGRGFGPRENHSEYPARRSSPLMVIVWVKLA